MSRLASRARLLPLSFLAATAIVAQSPPAASRASTDPDVVGAERLFSAWLEGQIAYRGLPGIAVGVVADQELVWAAGFGHANVQAKRPMTPDTKFRMASHSKLFTATAIMQLREQGKLRLDDPVSKYLPWFKVKPAGDDDGPITIEQLLGHASGLPREAGPHWTTMQFPTADEIRKLIADREAPFPPQERWKYSNLAYTIAGMVVEQVSGEPWADYVQRHIFQPLGMTRVERGPQRRGTRGRVRAAHAGRAREVLPFIDARGMAAATGLTSNRRGHGEVRLGPVPERSVGGAPDPEHRLAAGDAPRPLGGGRLDLGHRNRVRGEPGA